MLVPVQNPAVSGHGLCTPYNHAPVRTSALHFRSIYVLVVYRFKNKKRKTVLILFFIHASNLVKLFIEKGFGVKKSNESPITG